jgi:hypothetical protein
MRLNLVMLIAATAVASAACAEKPQTAQTRKSDVEPWDAGAAVTFAAPGWKAGDQASWEEQMRTRAQGQNEYSRVAR